jgi:hypothetical protein
MEGGGETEAAQQVGAIPDTAQAATARTAAPQHRKHPISPPPAHHQPRQRKQRAPGHAHLHGEAAGERIAQHAALEGQGSILLAAGALRVDQQRGLGALFKLLVQPGIELLRGGKGSRAGEGGVG